LAKLLRLLMKPSIFDFLPLHVKVYRMVFKTIALIANTSKEEAGRQAVTLAAWLKDKGVQVKMAHEDATVLKCDGLACKKEQLITGTDLIITLGGDGTVLRAVNILQGEQIPILAVNYGKFGFLQEVEPSNLYEDLELVLQGKYELEDRTLLEARFDNRRQLVLNDLVLTHDGFRVISLKTYINGTFFYEYAADGLAVANPTGATAYCLSAGGPIVNPQAKVNILTPLNPHSLMNRSIILDSKDVVDIKVASISGNLKISADGIDLYKGEPVDVQLTGSSEKVKLVKLKPSDFFGFLRKKLVILCGANGVN